MSRKVFISYRVSDSRTAATRLASELCRVFGDDAVFLDRQSLAPAGQWPEQLQAEVAAAAVVLVLIGQDWLTAQDEYGRRRLDLADDWVRQEVAAAFRSDRQVLPLLVNDAVPLPAAALDNLPDIQAVATAQALPLRDVDWEADFAALLDWLDGLGFERSAAPLMSDNSAPIVPPWHGTPYRGLSAFGPEDGPIFYGRERDTAELLRRIEHERVVAVIGPSGSGKSSLVAAGALPQLRKDWRSVRFTPTGAGDDPILSLTWKLAPLVPDAGSAHDLADRLRDSTDEVDAVAAEALGNVTGGAQLLLFVDQFEELFTARVDEAQRVLFVELIAAVGRSRHARLVLTLRADYTERCTRYESLTAQLRAGTLLLGAPGVSALKAMVERPAHAAGLTVESALVDRIIDDVGTEPGALALMEFTLAQLYDARVAGELTLSAYEALEGVSGAIGTQGERAVRDAGGGVDNAALGNIFRALATVDKKGGAVRKRARRNHEPLGEREEAIVDRLINERLLVTDIDTDGKPTVEIAHEAVLRNWKRFKQWLDENRSFELWRESLATVAVSGTEVDNLKAQPITARP